MELPKRISTKINKNALTGCWEWVACRARSGYGMVRWEGGAAYAHRVVFSLLQGTIPAGTEIDHLCRVRHCVNPDHLEPVSSAENTRRGLLAITVCRRGHPWKGRACKECRRVLYNEYRDKGKCWRCGKIERPGKTICTECGKR